MLSKNLSTASITLSSKSSLTGGPAGDSTYKPFLYLSTVSRAAGPTPCTARRGGGATTARRRYTARTRRYQANGSYRGGKTRSQRVPRVAALVYLLAFSLPAILEWAGTHRMVASLSPAMTLAQTSDRGRDCEALSRAEGVRTWLCRWTLLNPRK